MNRRWTRRSIIGTLVIACVLIAVTLIVALHTPPQPYFSCGYPPKIGSHVYYKLPPHTYYAGC